MRTICMLFVAMTIFSSCDETGTKKSGSNDKEIEMKYATDPHSYSKPNEAVVKHLDWNAVVDFESKTIAGTASWTIEKSSDAKEVIFDVRGLDIESVTLNDGEATTFDNPSEEDDHLGKALKVVVKADTKKVNINYKTAPDAPAFLWVEGDNPFLFTQSQAILARTWIPCQDSPGIRFTYDAIVKVPEGLLALMSAENPKEISETAVYTFKMAQPIPSYLLALAVGNIEYRDMGERTGVYAVPELIEAAAFEFNETEQMLIEAEKLYGEYAWDRYDLLILPAAFPFGGMENPRLTFATPTIIAGDRSLTALVAHELAHSWSGNLVTNATWDDFWLNEGFTVYFEQRIMEAVYGREISEMLATLSLQGLEEEVKTLCEHNCKDTHLKLDLANRNPDDGMTAIAYDKGYFFLRLLEETVSRPRFDSFLKKYFASHAFKVMDTETFVEYLKENLLTPEEQQTVDLQQWIYGPHLPDNCPRVNSPKIERVDSAITAWSGGELSSEDLPFEDWVYQERYRFLTNMPKEVGKEKLAELDGIYGITATGNNEVLFAWLEQCILKDYDAAYPRLEEFLVNVGRRKFLTPLYKAMKETGKMEMALDIYGKARANYHSVSTGTMDELLGVTVQ